MDKNAKKKNSTFEYVTTTEAIANFYDHHGQRMASKSVTVPEGGWELAQTAATESAFFYTWRRPCQKN